MYHSTRYLSSDFIDKHSLQHYLSGNSVSVMYWLRDIYIGFFDDRTSVQVVLELDLVARIVSVHK